MSSFPHERRARTLLLYCSSTCEPDTSRPAPMPGHPITTSNARRRARHTVIRPQAHHLFGRWIQSNSGPKTRRATTFSLVTTPRNGTEISATTQNALIGEKNESNCRRCGLLEGSRPSTSGKRQGRNKNGISNYQPTHAPSHACVPRGYRLPSACQGLWILWPHFISQKCRF